MQSQFQNKSFLIPLYLGITGHRDIRDEDRIALKKMICNFIRKNQIQCPNTPIVLLTPLAEGADQIAAQAAIECKIEFVAVLPMPIEEYKRDFTAPEVVSEFEKLLSIASSIIHLPLQKGTTIENVRNDQNKRDKQYYQNGLLIARQCHTLIALWDGIDNGKLGGTANVVKLKISGIPGKFEDITKRLRHLQSGPIYHIITPRKSNTIHDKPKENPIRYPAHYAEDKFRAADTNKELLSNIDTFNKNITRLETSLKEKIKRSENHLFSNYPDLVHNQSLKNIAEKYAVSGELSTYFQRKRFVALKLLLTLVVLAFFFLHVNAEFFNSPFLLLFYPITMGIGASCYYLAKKKRYENMHEDYRALSEAYRVQFFLKACGRLDNVSDHYLKRHRGQLEWVLYSLRTSHLLDWENKSKRISSEIINPINKFVFLKTNWIDDQLNYFKKKSKQNNGSSKKIESWANWFFLSAIFSAIILFLAGVNSKMLSENIISVERVLEPILACSTSVFLVLAAALHGYSEKMIFSEQAKNYQQMGQLFQLASDKLKDAIENNNIIEANDIIGELAEEALLENGDWLLLHRSRPIEVPKG